MEIITTKAKISVPNYEIDNLSDIFTFYSKTNTKFQVQFNPIEIHQFIQELVQRYHFIMTDDSVEYKIEQLENEVDSLEDDVIWKNSEIRKLEDSVEKLTNQIEEFKIKVNELYKTLG